MLDRLEFEAEEREIVLALVRDHLIMSAALRRDIFDPETLRALAEKVATPTRLRMLCLMTYADVRAVNPEALTPWKAENLWQLFIATSNWMDRNVDEERYHASLSTRRIVAPHHGDGAGPQRADAALSRRAAAALRADAAAGADTRASGHVAQP